MSDRKYTSIHRKDAAGRIEFKGGKAVWQWLQDANDSTSILIESPDNPEIEREKTQRTPIVPAFLKASQSTSRFARKGATASADSNTSRAAPATASRDTTPAWTTT